MMPLISVKTQHYSITELPVNIKFVMVELRHVLIRPIRSNYCHIMHLYPKIWGDLVQLSFLLVLYQIKT